MGSIPTSHLDHKSLTMPVSKGALIRALFPKSPQWWALAFGVFFALVATSDPFVYEGVYLVLHLMVDIILSWVFLRRFLIFPKGDYSIDEVEVSLDLIALAGIVALFLV